MPFDRKGLIDDPLTEILRTGARRLIAQAVVGGVRDVSGLDRGATGFRMAADGWFATGMIRFARSRPELARSKCKSRRPAIAPPLRASAFASRRTSSPTQGRTKSLDALLPVLDLRGISAGDFQEVNRSGIAGGHIV